MAKASVGGLLATAAISRRAARETVVMAPRIASASSIEARSRACSSDTFRLSGIFRSQPSYRDRWVYDVNSRFQRRRPMRRATLTRRDPRLQSKYRAIKSSRAGKRRPRWRTMNAEPYEPDTKTFDAQGLKLLRAFARIRDRNGAAKSSNSSRRWLGIRPARRRRRRRAALAKPLDRPTPAGVRRLPNRPETRWRSIILPLHSDRADAAKATSQTFESSQVRGRHFIRIASVHISAGMRS